jgi:hypothetical protein
MMTTEADDLAQLDKPLPVLKVTCTSTDCDNNLHCFKPKTRGAEHPTGTCRECGADLIEWDRVHTRNNNDTAFTFSMLKNEMIRHHMWHIPFDESAIRKARNQGRKKVYDGVRGRLKSSIGKAANGFDGRQTGMSGRVVYYAQHATATCCRQCLEYWHDIPRDRPLTETELDYCEHLVVTYLEDRADDIGME